MNNAPVFRIASTSVLIVSACLFLVEVAAAQPQDIWLGTSADGIYHVTLDEQTGQLTEATRAAEVRGPGFLARHPNGKMLYAVARIDGAPGVVGYAINKSSAQTSLKLMNSQPIGDGSGTHLALDRKGRTLVTAQYGAGTVAVFPVTEDGRIEERRQLIRHQGGSRAYQRRQDSPHPHWVGFDPQNGFAFVPDLGLDQVVVYRLENGELTHHGQLALPPGSGPRHMKFTQDGRHAYVLNELTLTVAHCDYDASAGQLKLVEVVPTLTESEKLAETFNSASEIRIHPSQRFVYSANRGHDTITVFARDLKSGRLRRVEVEPIRGSWPRNFALSASGKWLLAAGRNSNTLTVFSVGRTDGRLQFVRQSVNVPQPICVLP